MNDVRCLSDDCEAHQFLERWAWTERNVRTIESKEICQDSRPTVACGAHVDLRSVGLWEAPSKLTGLLVAERIDRQVTAMAKIAFGEVILTL